MTKKVKQVLNSQLVIRTLLIILAFLMCLLLLDSVVIFQSFVFKLSFLSIVSWHLIITIRGLVKDYLKHWSLLAVFFFLQCLILFALYYFVIIFS